MLRKHHLTFRNNTENICISITECFYEFYSINLNQVLIYRKAFVVLHIHISKLSKGGTGPRMNNISVILLFINLKLMLYACIMLHNGTKKNF